VRRQIQGEALRSASLQPQMPASEEQGTSEAAARTCGTAETPGAKTAQQTRVLQ